MTTPRLAALLVITLSLLGCESFDPTGDYTGVASVTTQTRTYTRPVAEDGSANIRNSSGSESFTGTVATVRRIDERHLSVTILDCELRLEQDPEPNEHNTQLEPEQRCTFAIDDHQEVLRLNGRASFERDSRGLRLDVTGRVTRDINGVPEGYYASWSLNFNGT